MALSWSIANALCNKLIVLVNIYGADGDFRTECNDWIMIEIYKLLNFLLKKVEAPS